MYKFNLRSSFSFIRLNAAMAKLATEERDDLYSRRRMVKMRCGKWPCQYFSGWIMTTVSSTMKVIITLTLQD